jgi:hypothetical protein
MSMILDGSNGVTFNDASLQGAAASPYVLKNRIINGDMVIDQRNNGSSISINGTTGFPVDRFKVTAGGGGVISASRSTTAPTEFINSLSNTVSTADSSIASSDIYVIDCFNEGFNTADLGFGTANARTVTLSFWVRSSVTGTYGVRISNGSFSRCYVSTYTISAANTWEQKTVTIAGDTTGTWATDNSTGIAVSWDLGSGTNWNGTANTWQAGNFLRTSGCVNWIATSGATFYITGVQLEQNTSATPFERRLYGQELALCQRYYYKNKPNAIGNRLAPVFCESTTAATAIMQFPVSMRTNPTALEQSGTASDYSIYSSAGATVCSGVPTFTNASNDQTAIGLSVASGLTTGQGGQIRAATTNGYFAWSAEL